MWPIAKPVQAQLSVNNVKLGITTLPITDLPVWSHLPRLLVELVVLNALREVVVINVTMDITLVAQVDVYFVELGFQLVH